jgi:hypothetical protein
LQIPFDPHEFEECRRNEARALTYPFRVNEHFSFRAGVVVQNFSSPLARDLQENF